MPPGSSSKSAKAAAGAANNGSPRPPAELPVPVALKAGPRSASNATPKSNANTHTTAQLQPTVPGTSENGDVFYPGLSFSDGPDGQSGQKLKDGRIRNPVPSKLKGKTTPASGRFSVMTMDIRGKEMPADRDLAAKRTSESTAMAAQKAFDKGYLPLRKSNWVRVAEDSANSSVPFTGTTPYNHALYGLKPATNPPREKQSSAQAPRRLLPEEVKEEQARLLTLLRTIQPLRVVDQLCKALAYFGGIPDAPPPKEGIFPESAEANGSGAVFVGWVAEIFPDLDAQGRRKSRPLVAPASLHPPQSAEKRGRGRPKGSKASKARSDKGTKKGSKKNPLTGVLGANEAVQDNSWVDVDDSHLNEEEEEEDGNEDEEEGDDDVLVPSVRILHSADTGDNEATAGAKKRRRPNGSRNAGKEGNVEDFAPNRAPISALFSIGKKGGGRGGRPKGVSRGGPYQKQSASTNLASAANGIDPVVTSEPPVAIPQAPVPATASQAGDEYSLSALQAYNENLSVNPSPPSSSFQPVNSAPAYSVPQPAAVTPAAAKVKAKTPAKKRKRHVNDGEDVAEAPSGPPGPSGTIPSMPEPTGGMAQPVPTSAPPTANLTVPAPQAPPAQPATKRQRKSRAKPKIAAVPQSVASENVSGAVSQAAQAPANVPAPAPVVQPVDNQMYTTPTIEELEAQLEHDTQSPPPAYTEFGALQPTKQPQPPPALTQPPPQQEDFQAQSTPKPQQPLQSPLNTEPQRAATRPRQQYQQAATRTASPNIAQVNTASPHLSVQSASPSTGTAANAASPNLHQQRISNSQTPNSMTSQVQSQPQQTTQSYYPQPTASSASTYVQQTSSHYASPQPTKQQFAVPQSQQQQSYSSAAQRTAQQQPTYTSQQPQYSQQKQQSYPSQPQQSYSSPQHQYSSQRLQQQQQQYTTTSAETTPQTLTAPSHQYGTSTTTGYNSNDGSFRTNSGAGLSFNSTAYGPAQASQTSRTNNMYSSTTAGSYGNATQPASTYPAAASSRRNLPTAAGNHTSVQNVQSLPQNFGGLSDFGNLTFENNIMSGLESTAGSHSSLGLNAASYNLTAGNVSRPTTGSTNFGFDSGLRNDGSSYFGPLRR